MKQNGELNILWQRFLEGNRAIESVNEKSNQPIVYEGYFPALVIRVQEMKQFYSKALNENALPAEDRRNFENLLSYYERIALALRRF